ncbi:hypothetical protein HDU98_006024 [Podochytrium sp. JEL0797]|nr:hypothetical protein HDU98_006024 [Podochytrium sp. JEL0797]
MKENAFEKSRTLDAVAVAGVGALGYHVWLKHENKEHSEDAQAQFNSMAQQQQQDPAYQQQNFGGDQSGGDQQNY